MREWASGLTEAELNALGRAGGADGALPLLVVGGLCPGGGGRGRRAGRRSQRDRSAARERERESTHSTKACRRAKNTHTGLPHSATHRNAPPGTRCACSPTHAHGPSGVPRPGGTPRPGPTQPRGGPTQPTPPRLAGPPAQPLPPGPGWAPFHSKPLARVPKSKTNTHAHRHTHTHAPEQHAPSPLHPALAGPGDRAARRVPRRPQKATQL
jgi:hypothetical protein